MLSDPITITVATIAKVMPRVSSEGLKSTYRMPDLTFGLDVSHRTVTRDKKRRVITTAAFTQRKVVPDPLTAVNDFEVLVTSFQLQRPEAGFTTTEVTDQWAGFKTWLDTTIVTKLVGGES